MRAGQVLCDAATPQRLYFWIVSHTLVFSSLVMLRLAPLVFSYGAGFISVVVIVSSFLVVTQKWEEKWSPHSSVTVVGACHVSGRDLVPGRPKELFS